ncbi:MAG: DUF1266 domain-containing protein [Lachnospirales bacterium]
MLKKFILLLSIFSLLTSCSKEENTSPVINWSNSANMLNMVANETNVNEFGGYKVTNSNTREVKKYLKETWNITDKTDLIHTLKYLNDGYTNTQFVNNYNYIMNYQKNSNTDYTNTKSDEQVIYYFDTFGDKALIGFDYGRSNMLIGLSYVAGLISIDEAITYINDLIILVQEDFANWADFNNSFLRGLNFFSIQNDNYEVYDKYENAEKLIEDNPEEYPISTFNLHLN